MKTTSRKRNWVAEQQAFIEQIAPDCHFHCAFDGLYGVYFFVKNIRGETLFCSKNLPANHGLKSVGEMIGKTDHELTPGPLAIKYLSDDEEIYRTGLPLPPTIEICMDHVGLPAWYRTCKYPIKDRVGHVIGVMGTFQELHDRHSHALQTEGVPEVLRVLEDSLEEFPPIERLAAHAGTNVRNLQRSFKRHYRMSPRTYWMKLRIRKACACIASSQISLAQISSALGFCDQSSFSKHFRRHAGMTPKQYSRRHASHG